MSRVTKLLLFLILASQAAIWIILHNLNLNLALKLAQLEKKDILLNEEVQKTTIELAKLTSITYLKKEGDRLGLIQIDKIAQVGYSPLALIKENGQ